MASQTGARSGAAAPASEVEGGRTPVADRIRERIRCVNLNRVNLVSILRFSESPVLDPFSMSGPASLALLEELTSTAAITTRDGS